jgi:16S rRNA (uracil1498-N3)-methyltransferase
VVADLDGPTLDPEDAHHLATVLRLRPGELVTATDGRGGLVACRYAGEGRLEPEVEPQYQPAPVPAVTVGFAPVKGDRPEWAVQKLTEIGVDRIVLVRADRSVVRWEDKRAEAHLQRLRKVAREAVMQSRRCWLPQVCGVEPVPALLGPGVALAQPGGPPPTLAFPTVLIGPEGGWSDDERDSPGGRVGLGPGVMRTETAAVAAGVLLVALRSATVRPG